MRPTRVGTATRSMEWASPWKVTLAASTVVATNPAARSHQGREKGAATLSTSRMRHHRTPATAPRAAMKPHRASIGGRLLMALTRVAWAFAFLE